MDILFIRARSFLDITLEQLEKLRLFDKIHTNLCLDKESIVNTVIRENVELFYDSPYKLLKEIKTKKDSNKKIAIVADVEWKEFYHMISENEGMDFVDFSFKKNHGWTIDNLIEIMDILRCDRGCPWDKDQNHASLKPYFLEECYEALEAIDNMDFNNLREELGDVLLQIIFHAQIAREEKRFDAYDVIQGIVSKLVYRHPHVFRDTLVNNQEEALDTWNKMKSSEKGDKPQSYIKDVPKALPSLLRAAKVQHMAAKVGFDWENIDGALEKVKEEVSEFLAEVELEGRTEEELGDVIFSLVNVSRFLNINPELALNHTIEKFVDRFKYIEARAKEMGKDLHNMELEEMDMLWNMAKIHKI